MMKEFERLIQATNSIKRGLEEISWDDELKANVYDLIGVIKYNARVMADKIAAFEAEPEMVKEYKLTGMISDERLNSLASHGWVVHTVIPLTNGVIYLLERDVPKERE